MLVSFRVSDCLCVFLSSVSLLRYVYLLFCFKGYTLVLQYIDACSVLCVCVCLCAAVFQLFRGMIIIFALLFVVYVISWFLSGQAQTMAIIKKKAKKIASHTQTVLIHTAVPHNKGYIIFRFRGKNSDTMNI